MTDKELLRHQIDDAGYQLTKVFEGIEETSLDSRVTEKAMTPREVVAHLAEAYQATIAAAAGKEHQWGSYAPADSSWPAVWNEMMGLRERAAEAILESGKVTDGNAFIVAHDYYHVGQICSLRLIKDPEWDAYSIYKHG